MENNEDFLENLSQDDIISLYNDVVEFDDFLFTASACGSDSAASYCIYAGRSTYGK